MNNVDVTNEFQRLNFEDILWILVALLSIMNLLGDNLEKDYLKSKNKNFKCKSNILFVLTIMATLLIYIYFFIRNYNALENATDDKKELYVIKLLGSIFLISGALCLLYFQMKQSSFVGSPSL